MTKSVVRTCRSIHQCSQSLRFITFGERYNDYDSGRRVHLSCKKSKAFWLASNSDIDVPKIVDHLLGIPLDSEHGKVMAKIFTHTSGTGRRYLITVNFKGISPSEIAKKGKLVYFPGVQSIALARADEYVAA